MLVTCPECEQLISGHRFAPHLEKCMRGGKRGTKKTSFTELMLPYSSAPRVKAPVVDPHPSSLIVRIKLRNGGNDIVSACFLLLCALLEVYNN